jgi:nucleotide-binding universal stress UspA family protein
MDAENPDNAARQPRVPSEWIVRYGRFGQKAEARFSSSSRQKETKQEETHMFKNILVPTDGSDLAAKAVEQGILFAKEIGAKITAVTVTEPFHAISVKPSQLEYTPIEYKKHAETHAAKVLGTVVAAATSAGVACETLHVEHEHVYQAIIDAASARRCDLIVMASHGRRGVSAVVLGSETVKVLTHSKIPVLVYR